MIGRKTKVPHTVYVIVKVCDFDMFMSKKLNFPIIAQSLCINNMKNVAYCKRQNDVGHIKTLITSGAFLFYIMFDRFNLIIFFPHRQTQNLTT